MAPEHRLAQFEERGADGVRVRGQVAILSEPAPRAGQPDAHLPERLHGLGRRVLGTGDGCAGGFGLCPGHAHGLLGRGQLGLAGLERGTRVTV
jgi:hypothetical protein